MKRERKTCAERPPSVEFMQVQSELEGLECMHKAKSQFVAKSLVLGSAALLSTAALAMAGQNTATKTGAWSGVLVTSACNADEAFNESPECFKNVPGAKIALYDDTNRVMYGLEPQKSVAGRLGETVTIGGTLNGEAIEVSSVERM